MNSTDSKPTRVEYEAPAILSSVRLDSDPIGVLASEAIEMHEWLDSLLIGSVTGQGDKRRRLSLMERIKDLLQQHDVEDV